MKKLLVAIIIVGERHRIPGPFLLGTLSVVYVKLFLSLENVFELLDDDETLGS